MSVAPSDLLAQRHKRYRTAQDRYLRATAREAATEKVAQLEATFRNAEARDRIALGDALIDQRRPPKADADDARSRVEEAKRDAEALAYAEERAAAGVEELPRKHRIDWLRQADADLEKARDSYETRTRQMADARDRLADLASLVHLLEHGQQGQPLGGALRQRLSDGSVRTLDFGELVGLMLVEAAGVEEATRLDPNRPQPEPQFHQVYRA